MANAQSVVAYECPICEELYEIYENALDCCPDEPEEAEVWQCDCGELFFEKEDADNCCNDKDSEEEA